jgi:hypothetical protein
MCTARRAKCGVMPRTRQSQDPGHSTSKSIFDRSAVATKARCQACPNFAGSISILRPGSCMSFDAGVDQSLGTGSNRDIKVQKRNSKAAEYKRLNEFIPIWDRIRSSILLPIPSLILR